MKKPPSDQTQAEDICRHSLRVKKAGEVAAELDRIYASSPTGTLLPKDVVTFAKDPKTALYGNFTWDDAVAGHKWRLSEAQAIIVNIKATVVVGEPPMRVWVNLSTDRAHGLGYRRTVEVLQSEDMTRAYIQDALADLEAVRARYQHIRNMAALTDIWRSVNEAREAHPKPPKTKARPKASPKT